MIVVVAGLEALDEGGRVWAVGYDTMLEDCYVIVMRGSDNKFGPVGSEYISAALRELTRLLELDLDGDFVHECGICGACGVG
jgi:hypothetical protein